MCVGVYVCTGVCVYVCRGKHFRYSLGQLALKRCVCVGSVCVLGVSILGLSSGFRPLTLRQCACVGLYVCRGKRVVCI